MCDREIPCEGCRFNLSCTFPKAKAWREAGSGCPAEEIAGLRRILEGTKENLRVAQNQNHVLRSNFDDLRTDRNKLIGELSRAKREGNNTQKLVSALRGASGRLLREALDCLPSHELTEIARAVHGRIYKRLEG